MRELFYNIDNMPPIRYYGKVLDFTIIDINFRVSKYLLPRATLCVQIFYFKGLLFYVLYARHKKRPITRAREAIFIHML
jgi:hypothetical protein